MPRTPQDIVDQADRLAKQFEDHVPGSSNIRDAASLHRVRVAFQKKAASECDLAEAVQAAREDRQSWAIIGTMLGTSGEAARQRYGSPAARSDNGDRRRMKRTTSTFGLSTGEWEEAKAQLREAILKAAWKRRMTWYGEIAPQVTVINVDPHSSLINHLLGAIFEDEHAAGKPLLTSIVTHKDGDKEPGTGFYEMARKLGYRFSDPLSFWATQVQEVFKLHGKPERSPHRSTN